MAIAAPTADSASGKLHHLVADGLDDLAAISSNLLGNLGEAICYLLACCHVAEALVKGGTAADISEQHRELALCCHDEPCLLPKLASVSQSSYRPPSDMRSCTRLAARALAAQMY